MDWKKFRSDKNFKKIMEDLVSNARERLGKPKIVLKSGEKITYDDRFSHGAYADPEIDIEKLDFDDGVRLTKQKKN